MCVNMSSVQFLQSQDEDLGEFCNNNYIFCKMECDYECINQQSPIERHRGRMLVNAHMIGLSIILSRGEDHGKKLKKPPAEETLARCLHINPGFPQVETTLANFNHLDHLPARL